MLDPYIRLKEAVILDKLLIVKLLLRRYPELLHQADYANNGWSLLHYASFYGNYLICVFLIQMGCDANNNIKKDLKGNLAIHLSIIKGDEQTCHLLLQHFPTSIEYTDAEGNTPLLLACKHGHHKLVSLLLSCAANLRAKNFEDDSALHVALKHGNLDCCEVLIKAGLDDDILNSAGYKPSDVAFTFEIQRKYLEYLDEIETFNTDEVLQNDLYGGVNSIHTPKVKVNYKSKATLPEIYTTNSHRNSISLSGNHKNQSVFETPKRAVPKRSPSETIYMSTTVDNSSPNTNKEKKNLSLKTDNIVHSYDEYDDNDGTVATPLLSGNRNNLFFNYNNNPSKTSLVRKSSEESLAKISERSREFRESSIESEVASKDFNKVMSLSNEKKELNGNSNFKRQSLLATVPISKVRDFD